MPKGVFHIRASYNNIIVTIIDIQGQGIISCSSIGACGFRGIEKSMHFFVQITAKKCYLYVN
jgi:small subunit ribosomal protein S11